ncbi:MAG: YqaA family protein [Limnobacter sp.]|nr:YqaA family protein [Limnobacter sp.]
MSGYLILFSSAFLAATVLPFYSEVILVAMVREGIYPAWTLVVVASTGNTLGALVNWFLGRYLLRFQDRKWFWFNPTRLERWQNWFNRFGKWSLLFAWAPVGGDALTFIAGVMRVHWLPFLILVGLGKSVRYVAVVYFGEFSLEWF